MAQEKMKIDMRKWTERKIALWALGLSLISFLTSICLGIKANNLGKENNRINNQLKKISHNAYLLEKKISCRTLIEPKFDLMREQFLDLPTALTRCAQRPSDYCDDARQIHGKIRRSILTFTGSLTQVPLELKRLLDILTPLQGILSNSLIDKAPVLIDIAEELSKYKNELDKVEPHTFSCN
jgi:hypothetical protein